MRTSTILVLTWLLTATLTATLTGCSSTVLSSDDDLQDEVDELKNRVLELQRKAAVSEVEMARLREQVAVLDARLKTAGGAAPRPRQAAPTAAPRATAEVTEEATEELIEVAELLEPVAVDVATPVPPSAESSSTMAPKTGVVPSEPLPPAAQALYDRGYTLFHQGQYLDAEASFQRFLESYPESDLSDNAEYWIGECRFARRDYPGALQAFRRTVTRYPKGNKVADALLKAGQTHEQLGDVAAARRSYQEVGRRFPDSAAAVAANERLQSL